MSIAAVTRIHRRGPAHRTLALCAIVSLSVCAGDARAHKNSRARVAIEVIDRTATVVFRGTNRDLAPLLEVLPEVRPIPALYRAKHKTVLRNIAGYLTLRLGDQKLCTLSTSKLVVRRDDGVEARLAYRCPRRPDRLTLRYDILFDHDALHRAFVSARLPGKEIRRKVLTTSARSVHLEQDVSIWDHAKDYLWLGVEHIFTGADHLLFLLALLLAGALRPDDSPRGRREGGVYLLKIVTAFTVAHSMTLLAAALEVVSIPGWVVEPAIAATIVYVGLENILVRTTPRRRWLLTFAFGLVHGFGFAHILHEIGLPARGLALSLLSFNLGVEVGQLAVVALLFPIIHLMSRGGAPGPIGRLLIEGGLQFFFLGALFLLLTLGGVVLTWQPLAAAACLLASIVGARYLGYRRAVLFGGSLLICAFGAVWFVQRVFLG